MQQDQDFLKLVHQAVAGDRQSVSALAEQVRDRVCAYLRRVVLNADWAEDLTQETMMAMLQSIGQLREPQRFWPWIFTIASNKVKRSHQQIKAHLVALSEIQSITQMSQADEPGPAEVIHRQELIEMTRSALGDLDIRSRMVLAMRFYEDMPHSAISSVLGCSELTTRVILLRAKRALLKALKSRGLTEAVRVPARAKTVTSGTALAVALTAFGEATRPATAKSVMMGAPVLKEGILRWLLTRKTTIAAAVLLAALVWFRNARMPARPAPLGIHFTELSFSAESANLPFKGTHSQGAYEQWYKFPEGEGGPFFYRQQRWDPRLKGTRPSPLQSGPTQGKLCGWVQNDSANFYILAPDNTVYINNARVYHADLRVETLPTDSETLVNFIREVESIPGALPYHTSLPDWDTHSATIRTHSNASNGVIVERDPKTGHASRKIDSRFPELGPPFESKYEYALQSADLFNAPIGSKIIDTRDEAHKRGWTYFRINGEIDGRPITGRGQIPFFYSTIETHRPWLQLWLEGKVEIIDTPDGASISRLDEGAPRVLFNSSGSFLSGLRPWMGFHSIDLLRRDAAAFRISFETLPPDSNGLVGVRLVDRQGDSLSEICYRVDMVRDVIKQIDTVSQLEDGLPSRGTIALDYLENIEGLGNEFTMPTLPVMARHSVGSPPGPLWPIRLLN